MRFRIFMGALIFISGVVFGSILTGAEMTLRNDCTWHADKTFSLRNMFSSPFNWKWMKHGEETHCEWAKQ